MTIQQAHDNFLKEFKEVLTNAGNTLTLGIAENSNILYAYLENKKGLKYIPVEYQGYKVIIKIIGKIKLIQGE